MTFDVKSAAEMQAAADLLCGGDGASGDSESRLQATVWRAAAQLCHRLDVIAASLLITQAYTSEDIKRALGRDPLLGP